MNKSKTAVITSVIQSNIGYRNFRYRKSPRINAPFRKFGITKADSHRPLREQTFYIMKQTFLFATLLLLSLSACRRESSADVNQKRIFTIYELFYNENEDVTYARAWFRFGHSNGTLLELASPSEVTFEGDKLSFNNVLAFYEKKYAGYKSFGTFHWEDTEGMTYDNSIEIHPIHFAALADTISRSGAFEIPWTGDPLAAKESAGAWINGENEGDAQATVTIENGAASLIMPANQMSKIGAGPGQIFIQRSYFPDLMQATEAGGSIFGRYRPKFEEVVFE